MAQGTNSRNHMQYNSGNDLFSSYNENNAQEPVSLYVRHKAQPTGLDAATRQNTPARKRIVNGQVVIERNGRRFNTLGQTIQ